MTNGKKEPSTIKKLLEDHPVWWALALLLAGATGMWHLEHELNEQVKRVAQETARFPRQAVVAFSLEQCPSGWEEVRGLAGRFIVAAGKSDQFGERRVGDEGGSDHFKLTADQLPPHTHDVYWNAGQIVGPEYSSTHGAGGNDTNKASFVQGGKTGPGPGNSADVKSLPPWRALLFCSPRVGL